MYVLSVSKVRDHGSLDGALSQRAPLHVFDISLSVSMFDFGTVPVELKGFSSG